MVKPTPFSITPDAEDYVRNRLNEMPSDAEPVIILETKLGEPLDGHGKKIRWWYEGENFLIGYFDPAEKPQTEKIELLGRGISITSEALRRLAGQTLTLRRVNSPYGLVSVPHYVLVTDSAPDTIGVSFETNGRTKNNLSIAGLTILGGFSGMGAIWIVGGIVVGILKIPDSKFLPLTFPLLVAGWIIGAIVGFFFFKSVYKTKGRTKFVQEQSQRKYIGYGGLGQQLSWWAFLGIPTPLTIALVMFLEHFAHTVGEKTAVVFVAIMVVFVPIMYFCDQIKHRIVVRLGLLGWALTIMGGYWYFKTYGP